MPGPEEYTEPFEAEEFEVPTIRLLHLLDGLVTVARHYQGGHEEDHSLPRMLVSVNLLSVPIEVRPPVLSHAVCEDCRLSTHGAEVDRVAALVLEAAQRFKCRILFERHQVTTE